MRKKYTRIIIHQFDPEFAVPGGVDTCLRDMLSLAPKGETILVLGVSQQRTLGKRVSLEGFNVAVDFIPVSRANPGNQSRLIPHSIRLALGALPQLIRIDTKDAVLQYHRIEPGMLAGLVKARKRIFFIHTNTRMSLQSNSDSFWKRIPRVYKFIEERVLNRADVTIVFNKPTFEDLKLLGYRVQRRRTWFNDSLYFPASNAGEREQSVVWVGRLESPKDPVFAVEVFAALESIVPQGAHPFQYIIIGEGTLRAEVEDRISSLGLADRVQVTGALKRDEVALRMRAAGVLLMTSHFEGSPRVMYEAMGSGTPVVVSEAADPDGAVSPEINGRVVPDRNPEKFAHEIFNAIMLPPEGVAASVQDQAASRAIRELWEVTNAA